MGKNKPFVENFPANYVLNQYHNIEKHAVVEWLGASPYHSMYSLAFSNDSVFTADANPKAKYNISSLYYADNQWCLQGYVQHGWPNWPSQFSV